MQETIGPPKFSAASLHTCHVLGPRQAFKELAIIAPLVLASVTLTTSPPASTTTNGAVCTSGSAGSLMAYMFPCVRFVCLVRRSPFPHGGFSLVGTQCPLSTRVGAHSSISPYLLNPRNTRYGWLARPYPTETFTRQEAPSFTWRTNVTYLCEKTSSCILAENNILPVKKPL